MEQASKKIFYSMGEVSEMLDVKPSLIRFWEASFSMIKPHKNKKGNRMFTPQDVANLKLIYHLVKEKGMTLAGAEKVLKAGGGEVARDAELHERLMTIRSLLVEIREELKAGQGEVVEQPVEEEPRPAAPVAEPIPTIEPEPASAPEPQLEPTPKPIPKIVEQTLF